MIDLNKFKGIFPAFYACYDDNGEVCADRTQALVNYLYEKGVRGLYVSGSSGECIYQNLEERKKTIENVMKVAKGKMTVIAHVGCASTRDSIALAKYAENCGVDAIASIPPIYFGMPEYAICNYWQAMIDATELPFIIYNIPQNTGYNLSVKTFKKMCENPKVIGVKNSSMPVLDIQQFKNSGGDNVVIFNGPDEQFVAGRLMGADSGIGGTYGVMPELFIKAEQLICEGNYEAARQIQFKIDEIIMSLVSLHGNMYDVIKTILRLHGMEIGSARLPLTPVVEEDMPKINEISKNIDDAIKFFCT